MSICTHNSQLNNQEKLMSRKQIQLERVFLLNVLIYIPTIESIKKFIQINKKCQEVSTMVRTFTPKHRRDFHYQQKLQKTKIIPKNLFTIYPTIETIESVLYSMPVFLVSIIPPYSNYILSHFFVFAKRINFFSLIKMMKNW